MRNVIAFPKAAEKAPIKKPLSGAATLFVHIRRTTLIVHLAAPHAAAVPGNRIGKQF